MAVIDSPKVREVIEVIWKEDYSSPPSWLPLHSNYPNSIANQMECGDDSIGVYQDDYPFMLGCLDSGVPDIFSVVTVIDYMREDLGIDIGGMLGRFFDWFYSTPWGILLTIVFVIFFIIYMSGIYFRLVSQIGIFFLSVLGFVWTYWALESRVLLGNTSRGGWLYGDDYRSRLIINLYTVIMVVMQIIHFQLLIECYQYYAELWEPNMVRYFGESVWNHPEVQSEVFVGFLSSYHLGIFNNGYTPLVVITSLGVIWGHIRFFFPQRWLGMNTKAMGWVFMVIGAATLLFSSKDYEDLIVRIDE